MSGPAATVPLSPGPSGPGLGASADDPAITLSWAELDGEIHQAERTGLCAHPVRLRGRIDAIDLATGELRPVYDTGTEPTASCSPHAATAARPSARPAPRSTSATPASSSAPG
jgi:hypothetical protein